jgi:hypothetical protein
VFLTWTFLYHEAAMGNGNTVFLERDSNLTIAAAGALSHWALYPAREAILLPHAVQQVHPLWSQDLDQVRRAPLHLSLDDSMSAHSGSSDISASMHLFTCLPVRKSTAA